VLESDGFFGEFLLQCFDHTWVGRGGKKGSARPCEPGAFPKGMCMERKTQL
jgi:hypothetical protein